MQNFCSELVAGNLLPYYKSEPIPIEVSTASIVYFGTFKTLTSHPDSRFNTVMTRHKFCLHILQSKGDVRVVVGKTFDDIVLNSSQDVLLEVSLTLSLPYSYILLFIFSFFTFKCIAHSLDVFHTLHLSSCHCALLVVSEYKYIICV
jgi:hypothetical protein